MKRAEAIEKKASGKIIRKLDSQPLPPPPAQDTRKAGPAGELHSC